MTTPEQLKKLKKIGQCSRIMNQMSYCSIDAQSAMDEFLSEGEIDAILSLLKIVNSNMLSGLQNID